MTAEERRRAIDAIVASAPVPAPAQVELVLRVGLVGEVRRGEPIH